MSELKCWDEV